MVALNDGFRPAGIARANDGGTSITLTSPTLSMMVPLKDCRTFAQIARELSSTDPDRRIGVAGITRWHLSGTKGRGGRRHLPAAKFGGRWVTSMEAVSRFFESLASTADIEAASVAPSKAAERADRTLAAIGI